MNNDLASSTISPLIYFFALKDPNILTKLRALGYPKNFLQIQETVVFSEDCQNKHLYAIDHKRYSRLTIFTNEKIFLNRKDYKLELYSRANISIDFFKIITTNTSSIHLHFYRYDSTNIKQVFDAAATNKVPHPMKNILLSIHEPWKSDTSMTDFRFHKKIT